MDIVVMGGSHAAIGFAAELRKHDTESRLVIISADHSLPYHRPPLSKAYMSGKSTLDQILLRPGDWYETNQIELKLGMRVAAIIREDRHVLLTDGEKISYDRLVIATGADPRRLPEEMGGLLENVHVMRDLSDADRLMAEMADGRRLVVIGGGYIGLEAASEAAKRGVSVTVIEAADRILKRVASKETADDVRELHRAHGVDIRENTALARIVGENGKATGVELSTGEVLPADFVITGIGVTPNVLIPETAGLTISNGISVDEHLQTSDPDIFAIGDCACFEFHGRPTRLESVQNANDMGVVAAQNVLGGNAVYRPVPWFWSDQFDLKLQIAGLNTGYDTVISRPGARPGAKSHFYFKGDTFLAADCLNDGATYMICRRLLEAGKGPSPEQVRDPQFVLKSLLG